jgi:uncharacterized protein (DUF1501 family)
MPMPPLPRPSRRGFLGAGLVGTLGLALSPAWQLALAREGPRRRAKACILLWLNGGPSHIDTFDPKPGSDTNGPFKPIATTVTGLQFSEHLPKLAEQARHLAVLRSLTSREADHDRAFFYLHTGNQRDETVEHPGLGALVARAWSAEESDLPAFVSINGSSAGPGFLGVSYAPHVITNLDAPVDNVALPDGVSEQRLDRRLQALEAFNRSFAQRTDAERVAEFSRVQARAARFRKSPALKAFDLSEEKPEMLVAYGARVPGDNQDAAAFGKACLVARRLVEHGVRFVEVMLDGWDTHTDNFNQVAALLKQLDPAFAALTADLADRRLLDDTLVLCLGEFGRTPEINGDKGRDHWSQAFSAVLAGGGVRGGQVYGATDDKGAEVKDRPVGVPDLYATLLKAFGIDGTKTYRTPGGRPIKLADKGKIVEGLFA